MSLLTAFFYIERVPNDVAEETIREITQVDAVAILCKQAAARCPMKEQLLVSIRFCEKIEKECSCHLCSRATRQKVCLKYNILAHRYCIYCSRLSPENKILNTARTGGLSLSGCFQPSENCCSTTVGVNHWSRRQLQHYSRCLNTGSDCGIGRSRFHLPLLWFMGLEKQNSSSDIFSRRDRGSGGREIV
jgi:hypothetical protein